MLPEGYCLELKLLEWFLAWVTLWNSRENNNNNNKTPLTRPASSPILRLTYLVSLVSWLSWRFSKAPGWLNLTPKPSKPKEWQGRESQLGLWHSKVRHLFTYLSASPGNSKLTQDSTTQGHTVLVSSACFIFGREAGFIFVLLLRQGLVS